MPTIGDEAVCTHCGSKIVYRQFQQIGTEEKQAMWIHKKTNEASCLRTFATPPFASFRG